MMGLGSGIQGGGIFGVQKRWDKNKEYGVSVMVISPLMMTIGSMFGTAQVRTSVERDLL